MQLQDFIAALVSRDWLVLAAAVALAFVVFWRTRLSRPWRDRTWFGAHYVSVIGWLTVVLAPFWLLLVVFFGKTLTMLLIDGPPSGQERDHYYAVGVIATGFAAVCAAPFLLIKTWINERNTRTSQLQSRTAEEGLTTQRLTRAIEMLGAEKTVKYRARTISYDVPAGDSLVAALPLVQRFGEPEDIPEDAQNVERGEWQTVEETLPNLEVRLGAIYALERISQDSERDHIHVMEVLCAYIRENAPASSAKPHDLGEFPGYPEGGGAEAHREWLEAHEAHGTALKAWLVQLPLPRVDIQAAATAIGRRGEERRRHEKMRGYRLNLRSTNLRRADLNSAHLEEAHFTEARMERARLGRAHLERASLEKTHLEGAWLLAAHIDAGKLEGAHLEAASLSWAILDRASIRDAHLHEVTLDNAHLEESKLNGSHLERASLTEATLRNATVDRASLQGAWLTEAHLEIANLTNARLDGAWLDWTGLKSADLRGWTCPRASLRGADLTGAENLDPASLPAAMGVRSGPDRTILPEGVPYPAHWHDAPDADTSLESREAYENAFKAWRDSPDDPSASS